MIWVLLAGLAAIALAPLALGLLRARVARGRRAAAVALHRAQLAELDREQAGGRLGAAEHAAATLEVQRRLLAETDGAEEATIGGSPWAVGLALLFVPAAAFGLYLIHGTPEMPSLPFAERQEQDRRDDALIAQLGQKLAALDPKDEHTRQGYLLLGSAEENRGHWAAAAAAYKVALAQRFDPALAARTAEALSQAAGEVTPEAKALYQKALDGAPQNAQWRPLVEQRIKQAAP
jgi:cytochrome c-type biogenesis protein CcmH